MELLNKKMIEEDLYKRKARINDITNSPKSRGYFESANYRTNSSRLYLESKDDNVYIAKRNNVSYSEYKLSSKDINYILTALEILWKSEKPVYQTLSRTSRGKKITIEKVPSGKIQADGDSFIELTINDVTMIMQLDRYDSRRFYALLKELQIFGKSNKLVDNIM